MTVKQFCSFGVDPRQPGTGCLLEEGHTGGHRVIEADPDGPDYGDIETEQA